ncbi:MAG: hypothetical protein IJ769_11885 [Clostridia bacterium]|nr:hypothetical protein [Clostridia bacterium]
MQKILFVSHCILNTAAKVVLFNQAAIDAEEALRMQFLAKAIGEGIQLVQLPCPEFTLYGSRRWGHCSNQFDNPFFREHCRKCLGPVIQQLREYLAHPERFQVLGIVGVDGSPSCGVDHTSEADWHGSFGGRTDLEQVLKTQRLVDKSGIFIQELKSMLAEACISEQVPVIGLFAPEAEKCMALLEK